MKVNGLKVTKAATDFIGKLEEKFTQRKMNVEHDGVTSRIKFWIGKRVNGRMLLLNLLENIQILTWVHWQECRIETGLRWHKDQPKRVKLFLREAKRDRE